MTERPVHLDGFNRRHADTPMQRRKPSAAPSHVQHEHRESFAGTVAELAAAAAGEIERSIIRGRPLAVVPMPGEKPELIQSPTLRLLARQARAELGRMGGGPPPCGNPTPAGKAQSAASAGGSV